MALYSSKRDNEFQRQFQQLRAEIMSVGIALEALEHILIEHEILGLGELEARAKRLAQEKIRGERADLVGPLHEG